MLWSWVEAGGFPACPEEEVKGLLAEVSPFPCPLTYYWSFSPNLAFSLCIVYLSLFSGIEIIGTSQQEAGRKCRSWRRKHSVWKQRDGGNLGRQLWGQRQRVSMDSWEESHHIPIPSFPSLLQKDPPYAQLPWFPTTCSRVHMTWSLRSCRPGHCVCFFSCHLSSRWRHPSQHATPQNSTGECQVSVPVPGWGLQRGPINLMGCYLHHVRKGTLGGEVGVLTLQQDFLQPRCLAAS